MGKRMNKSKQRHWNSSARLRHSGASVVGALALMCSCALASDAPIAGEIGLVQAAMASYSGGKTSRCFATEFLRDVAFETDINVAQELANVEIGSENLFSFPFIIMTGEGAFYLSEAEVMNLRSYLERGGLLLASAGCSNADWDASMRRTIERLFPAQAMEKLTLDHELFHTIYDIKSLMTKKRTEGELFGVELDGRLAIVYSPEGLNDTSAAGGGCCCCGGNEVREAKRINANMLAYALMR